MTARDADVRSEWAAEKKAATRVYWWLLLSPFVAVPCFAYQVFDLYSLSTLGERVWAAVVPLLFHLPLLLMSFGAGRRFVRRHMQQALILIALRAGVAAISLSLNPDPENGLWLFFLGNGALWFIGSLRGLLEARRGDCWLMRWRGEEDELPRPWAMPSAVLDSAPVSPLPPADSPLELPANPNAAFEDGLRRLRVGKQTEATACFLAAFRAGSPDLRRRALAELDELDQVEMF